jgi:hypothetical protein
MANQIFNVGPLANKKHYSSSTVGDTTIQYAICTNISSNGSQLGVMTAVGKLTGEATKKQILLPKLPYRLMMGPAGYTPTSSNLYIQSDYIKIDNEYKINNWLKNTTDTQKTIEKDFIQFYNPGMLIDSNNNFKSNLDGMFSSSSLIKFAEMNWSRYGLTTLFTPAAGFYKRNLSSYLLNHFKDSPHPYGWGSNFILNSINVHDVQASMVVINYDSDFDYIYLGVCSRIELNISNLFNMFHTPASTSVYSQPPAKGTITKIVYTIPVIVKMIINRSEIIGGDNKYLDINPKLPTGILDTRIHSWTYGGNTDVLNNNSDRWFTRIDETSAYSDASGNLWNVSLIPCYSNYTYSSTIAKNIPQFVFPSCHGATIDLERIDNDNIVCSSSVGYWDKNDKYSQIYEVNKYNFSSPTGFFFNPLTIKSYSQKYENELIRSQTICKESGNAFLSTIDFYGLSATDSPSAFSDYVNLKVIQNDFSASNNYKIKEANSSDLVEFNGELYFYYKPSSGSGVITKFNYISDFINTIENFDDKQSKFKDTLSSRSFCSNINTLNDSPYYHFNQKYTIGWKREGNSFKPIQIFIDNQGSDRSLPVYTFCWDNLYYYNLIDNILYFNRKTRPNQNSLDIYPFKGSAILTKWFTQDNSSGTLPSYSGFQTYNLIGNYSNNTEKVLLDLPTIPDDMIKFKSFNGAPFIINSSYSVDFTSNPTLSYKDNPDQGIPIKIIFNDCSGLFSKNTIITKEDITGRNGKASNGFVINDYTRPELSFDYYYDNDLFNKRIPDGFSGLGYWAIGDDAEVTFRVGENTNLLFGGLTQKVKPHYYSYDQRGKFKFYIILNLDLSEKNLGGAEFTDADFTLEDCALTIKLFTPDRNIFYTHSTPSTNLITIDPPNGSGFVVASGIGGHTKTTSGVYFRMERDADSNSPYWTVLKKVEKYFYRCNTGENQYQITETINNKASDVYEVKRDDLKRGYCCYYRYEPYLAGVKPTVTIIPAKTDMITNCYKHRYHIENVSLQIYEGGSVWGDDILDKVSSMSDPAYVYVDTEAASVSLKVTADVVTENWMSKDSDPRLNMDESGVYPLITSGFLLAYELTKTYSNDPVTIPGDLGLTKNEYDAYDNAKTYPNVDISLEKAQEFINNASYLKLEDLTTSEYTASEHILTWELEIDDLEILRSGRYKIYMGIVDEFDQVSFWCITNKKNDYKIYGVK